jgi:hypothetical protein
VQERLQRVEHLGADPQALGERRRSRGDDHELLEVERVLRVHAAVHDVQHRDRQDARLLPTDPMEERDAGLRGPGARDREGDPEDRVRAQARLVRRPVEGDEGLVHQALVAGVETGHGRGELAVDVRDRAADPLAAPLGAAVAQLHRLELPRRRAGGDRGAPARPGCELHLDLHGRVAPRVEDLPSEDLCDRAHRSPSFAWS